MSDSDDQPQLNSSTIAALEQFLRDKQERENLLKHMCEKDQTLDVLLDEDWETALTKKNYCRLHINKQLSQFWYNNETIETFVRGALNSTTEDGQIALISCPTLYKKLKQECGKRRSFVYIVVLFEYDSRFKMYGMDFIQYDYKFPLDLPRDMSSQFDLVIADPPFLSDECLTKTAVTIKFLTKKHIVLCTGAIMTELAEKLLNVKKCDFIPGHKNNLANEFYCYSNFEFDKFMKCENNI